jgi:glycosyltransferase involved in cell wall biosynthesis
LGETDQKGVAMRNVKVSVILPSLNVADYIRECLDSAVNQSLEELEIICVDAGSLDGTKEILEDYADRDPRITVLHSDTKSYGKQVNMGLEYASGEYVAILETDDWIMQDMYRYLYEQGKENNPDYIAADFDAFYKLQNGAYYFIRHRLFGTEKQDWYGKLLNSDQIAELRMSDYVLWKGIYNRKFLNDNHIRLHESPGAAFQDMGFLQQVKTYARKAKYLDQSFYRYRQERENASSVALEGLQYYKTEFLWINDDLELVHILNHTHRKYYYLTMSISFITKYEQILVKLNGSWQDERLSGPYKWFKRQVAKAVNNQFLDESLYGKGEWSKLLLLLESQEAYARFVMSKEEKKKECTQSFIDMINNRPVVIFGCGVRGERLMRLCDNNHICIHSFCDNNRIFSGKKKFGFPILSPIDIKDNIEDRNEVILLSMKNDRANVCRQLTSMGIESDRIIDSIPEEILG